MSTVFQDRFLDYRRAFEDPLTTGTVISLAVLLTMSPLVFVALHRTRIVQQPLYEDLMIRWRSWVVISVLAISPVLLGAGWVMIGVFALSVLCYREFARATGLFRETAVSVAVVLGILLLTFAIADNFPRMYFAGAMLGVILITIISIPLDRPKGFLQRVALGVLAFLLFGYSFGYISLIAIAPDYRPILIFMLVAVEMNDVFAYCVGKTMGGPKLVPQTSPAKTVAGSLGSLVLSTVLIFALAHIVFRGTAMDHAGLLLVLGVGIAVLGQLGDLLMSSIKRDLGVKDIGALLPGHGGLLDRFDSLVLIPPAIYHFLSLVLGPLGAGQPERIFTGGG